MQNDMPATLYRGHGRTVVGRVIEPPRAFHSRERRPMLTVTLEAKTRGGAPMLVRLTTRGEADCKPIRGARVGDWIQAQGTLRHVNYLKVTRARIVPAPGEVA